MKTVIGSVRRTAANQSRDGQWRVVHNNVHLPVFIWSHLRGKDTTLQHGLLNGNTNGLIANNMSNGDPSVEDD